MLEGQICLMMWVFGKSVTGGKSNPPACHCQVQCNLSLALSHLYMMQTPADHSVKPIGIEYIELAGDQRATEEWMGTNRLPLRWVEGQPGIRAVGIKTESGTVVLK